MILHEEKCFWLYEDISYLNTIGDKCFVFNAFKMCRATILLKLLLVRKNIFESHFQMVKNFCRTGRSPSQVGSFGQVGNDRAFV